jgi:phosphoglycolate phosphatase
VARARPADSLRLTDLMSELRGILLDLDGTIADSIDFFYRLACEVLEEARCPAPARAEVLEAIAGGVAPFERFLPADFRDRERFLELIYRQRFPEWIRRYGMEIEPLPGAVDTVRALRDRGLSLALVTSSSGPLPFLDRWGIRQCFSSIIGREDVRRIKPDPEAVFATLERLRLSAPEVLNVGDTPLDVRAGLGAGVETIGVLTGAATAEQLRTAGAAAILKSLAELPDFLQQKFSDKTRNR